MRYAKEEVDAWFKENWATSARSLSRYMSRAAAEDVLQDFWVFAVTTGVERKYKLSKRLTFFSRLARHRAWQRNKKLTNVPERGTFEEYDKDALLCDREKFLKCLEVRPKQKAIIMKLLSGGNVADMAEKQLYKNAVTNLREMYGHDQAKRSAS